MATPADPRRLRWSVPAADVSTNRWLDEQENISRSLQLLIRESIQRDGYIDVVNRPVEQLPRRGRRPATGDDSADDQASDHDTAVTGRTGQSDAEAHHVAVEGAQALNLSRDQTIERAAHGDPTPKSGAAIDSSQAEPEIDMPHKTEQPQPSTSVPDGRPDLLDMDAIFRNRP